MAYEISAKMLLENPQRIEPALLEFAPPRVADLVAEISAAARALQGRSIRGRPPAWLNSCAS